MRTPPPVQGMDVLECLLHALRLVWVEFDSKFFRADGYKFHPLAFQLLGDGPDA